MIVFWVLAAGLTGLALLFIVPPLLRRKTDTEPGAADTIDEDQVNLVVFRQQLEELDADLAAGNLEQAQYDSARRDLEKELLLDIDASAPVPQAAKSGRWAALALAPAVPVLAVALYFTVGDPDAIEKLEAPPPARARADAKKPPSMDVLVAKLAKRMANDPDNLAGWVMLGRSYLAMGRLEDAVKTYEKARQLAPDEPDVLLGYAEVLAKSEGGLQGRAAELIGAAMELDPSNPNAIWMMGLVEFQRDKTETAIEIWTRLETLLEPGGEEAATLRGYIAKARQQAGSPAAEPAAAAAATQPAEPEVTEQAPATAGKSIRVEVSLAAGLQAKPAPEDTLFIFARALSGPPMPLAATRLQAKDLPASITLDDSMAMMPQMRLSNFDQVVVGARISRSGNATPQSGDLEGEVKPVTPGQGETVAVVIDGVRP